MRCSRHGQSKYGIVKAIDSSTKFHDTATIYNADDEASLSLQSATSSAPSYGTYNYPALNKGIQNNNKKISHPA